MAFYWVPMNRLVDDHDATGWAYVEAESPAEAVSKFEALPDGAIFRGSCTEPRNGEGSHWHNYGPLEWVCEAEAFPKPEDSDAAW